MTSDQIKKFEDLLPDDYIANYGNHFLVISAMRAAYNLALKDAAKIPTVQDYPKSSFREIGDMRESILSLKIE